MAKKIIVDFAQLNNKKSKKEKKEKKAQETCKDVYYKEIETLRKQKDAAEKSAKFMESVMGSVAHKIRSPLSIISLYAQLVRETLVGYGDESSFKQLDTIKNTAHSTNRFITKLVTQIKNLNVAEIDKSRFTFITKDIERLLAKCPIDGDEKQWILA